MSDEEKNGLGTASKEFNDGVAHFKLSIWVPTEAVGKVIGKKGAVIQHIQRETKTTCSIISLTGSDTESLEGPRWSPIVIMGDPSRALAAHNLIHDIVEEIDDAIVEFCMPNHLIPRQFQSHSKYYPSEAIQLLSAETSVRIHIPDKREISNAYKSRDRESHYNTKDMTISLEGEVSNIFKALSSFAVAVGSRNKFKNMDIPQPDTSCRFIGEDEGRSDRVSKSDKDNWRQRDKDDDNDIQPNYEQYVNIPSSLVGLLLAKRDSNPSVMKQIQRGSHTHITKLPDPVIAKTSESGEPPEIVVSDVDKEIITDVEDKDSKSSEGKNKSLKEDSSIETFCIRGSNAASVELAASCLLRIVNGDKISNVLYGLNAHKSHDRGFKSSNRGTSKSFRPTKVDDDKKRRDVDDTKLTPEDTNNEAGEQSDDESGENDEETESSTVSKGSRIAGRGGGRGKSRGRGRGRGFGSRGSGKTVSKAKK